MVTRSLYTSVIALWFLAEHVWSQTTTARTPTPTSSALISTSTFVSPSLKHEGGGLSDKAKAGISVGVTLGAIIIGGSLAILCVIRKRNRTLMRPETRVPPSRDVDDEDISGGDAGKGKQVHYMNAPSTGQHGVFQQAPHGVAYHGGEYPAIPDQAYILPQQTQAMLPAVGQYGGTYAYSGTTYLGPTPIGANPQHGYAGPSNTQYQPEAHIHSQQQQQQQGGDLTWIYPVSTLSPVDGAPLQDIQYNYLQDYQPQVQASTSGHNQNGSPISPQEYQNDKYHVPLPRPDVSELPEQRRPVELMGEGHYKEVP
ncbi:hypothetical protein F5B22DRAFT_32357 [Xylaria bambusicola]|uniref:uncharacterized protein n=1 Tax=Xylaria bambusicola TaxID=326684 RepID=UPI0020076024|nr:uncharacterized protein F5B22DRAFT_32357 [Xylaria bambusicola]KAI0520957.1 hypothetical protein F5B22DRAFT_32357 [Xylaria bambusicola]